MQRIPLIGKIYKFFDDGKLHSSRIYDAKVTRIISLEESQNLIVDAMDLDSDNNFILVPKLLFDVWNHEKQQCYWLFANETDFFVQCSIPDYDDNLIYFARTIDGGWFSMGIQDSWQGGSLDVDGSLYAYYLEINKQN